MALLPEPSMALPAPTRAAVSSWAERRAILVAAWRRYVALFRAPPEDTEFMRESDAALLEGPRQVTHWILWSIAAFFVVGLIWAALAQVDQIIAGQGQVVPSSRVQVVQNLEGGIVSSIAAKTGDVVTKGQVVMELDNTRFDSQLREGLAKDQSLRARIARLEAEAQGSSFVPPPQLQQENAAVVAEEAAVFEARRREFQSNVQVLRQQSQQKSQELEELAAKELQLVESYALVSRELDLTRPLVGEGAVSEVELLRLERAGTELRGQLESARLAMPRLRSVLAEVHQRIAGLEAQFRAEASKELSLARAEQSMSSASNVELKDRVHRTLVRAPMAGIVKQVKVYTVGGVVQPGMALLEIVPADDSLLIEARIRPADIAFLEVGQPATVKLSAYDYSIYGSLDAVLEQIGSDTVAPEDPEQKDQSRYYVVRVRTTSNRLRGMERPVLIIPGMEAAVDVKTQRRTVLEYLLKPIIKTRERALRER